MPEPEIWPLNVQSPAGARVGDEVHLPVRHVGADGHLVIAPHQRQVVADLVRVGVEDADGAGLPPMIVNPPVTATHHLRAGE